MKEEKFSPLHTFILLIFVLSLCSVLILLVLHLGIFNIKQIEIRGAKKVPNKEILKRSGLRVRESTIFFRKEVVKREIKSSPWVSDVKITRFFPNKVSIEVIEATPFWIVVGEGGELFYMSEEGRKLGRANFDEGLDFPVLIGKGIFNPDLIRKATEIRKLSEDSDVLNLSEISEIHLDSIYGISLYTMDMRRIDFGIDNIAEKWHKMEKMIKYTREINLIEEYINISSEKQGIVDFKL